MLYMATLTPDNVLQYLRKRNLINEEEVVKGNFRVVPVNTRNNIMKIEVVPGQSLFVKQLVGDAASPVLLKRETAAYGLFRKYSDTFPVASAVPALLDYNENDLVMVTELLDDAQNLHEHYMYSREFNPQLAREQAALLAAYHQLPLSEAETSSFPRLLPWVLQLNNFKANQFFLNNEASAHVISIIKEDALLQSSLARLASRWSATHLIHGDIKWINFLLTKNAAGNAQRLIDWELADMGDPLWDVAGLLQSHVVSWLFGFDDHNPANTQFPQQMEAFNITHMQPSAQAFTEEYMRLANITQNKRTEFLHQVMQYTAARILQTSIEGVTFLSKIGANNMRGVQLAHNIFKDPAYAMRELFSITI